MTIDEAIATFPHEGIPSNRYDNLLANKIELYWQNLWDENKIHQAELIKNLNDSTKKKFYVLDMFPYPSGKGLHVGHPLGYIATDVITRYKRMNGYNVLHPMGWDAFGLPAEQYAIQTGVHPAKTTREAIKNYKSQLSKFGISYDWSREFATIDTDYYKWTQWIWLKAFNSWFDPIENRAKPIEDLIKIAQKYKWDTREDGTITKSENGMNWNSLDTKAKEDYLNKFRIAYLDEQIVNWCPDLGTVLANEEVIDGRSERGGHPVFRKPLKQWMFRITAFCQRLLDGLDDIDWPDSTKAMQRQWIGRSSGADIFFNTEITKLNIDIFTTRPDTLFGVTFLVIAPEHKLIDHLIENNDTSIELKKYIQDAKNKSDLDRTTSSTKKTGIFTGINAIHPITKESIPIWCSDYVLGDYGTGAIMAVPGHDERDFEFATQFNLPIKKVIKHNNKNNFYSGEGIVTNSHTDEISLNEHTSQNAKDLIVRWLENNKKGKSKIQYKLRDWLFSRQRYWGEPFPIVFDKKGIPYPVKESSLPVELPKMDNFHPEINDNPTPLLSKMKNWSITTAREAGVSNKILHHDTPVIRETNTMPGWAGSCWYFLRFCDPNNNDEIASKENLKYWFKNGVDLYVGGAEHAVLHLLYSRFWSMLLFDLSVIPSPEPFKKLFHQGLMTSHAYQRKNGSLVPVDQVIEQKDNKFIDTTTQEEVKKITAKMSKSLKNIVNPDDVIAEYGADSFRLYEMSMGPLEASKPWNPRDIKGVYRFLQRTWRLVVNEENGKLQLIPEAIPEVEKSLNITIEKIGNDIERMSMNTAVSALIEFVNVATSKGGCTKLQISKFSKILSPFAPHIADEIGRLIGDPNPRIQCKWPTYDSKFLTEEIIEIPIQVSGKIKTKIKIPITASNNEIQTKTLNLPEIKDHLKNKEIRKVIIIPKKIINIVVS